MNSGKQAYVNVSGTDLNEGAAKVFVWSGVRTENQVLLGSGHVVGVTGRPPGIQVGQYCLTFILPPECSVDEIFVTDDTDDEGRLTGVIVTRCQDDPGTGFRRAGSSNDVAQGSKPAMSFTTTTN